LGTGAETNVVVVEAGLGQHEPAAHDLRRARKVQEVFCQRFVGEFKDFVSSRVTVERRKSILEGQGIVTAAREDEQQSGSVDIQLVEVDP
jgi:hypothetical protein